MAYAYWKGGRERDNAVFDVFFRKNPFHGEFTIFAGLEEVRRACACEPSTTAHRAYPHVLIISDGSSSQVLRLVQSFKFSAADLDYLR
jgi:nicotinic acid phosphoribosyltransferase